MPAKPPRPCPRCQRLRQAGERCPHCGHGGRVEGRRGEHRTQQKKWYDSARWKRATAAYKQSHPLCAICEREGRLTATECIDHIRPPKGDRKLFWDSENWQPSCLRCNAAKGARGE